MIPDNEHDETCNIKDGHCHLSVPASGWEQEFDEKFGNIYENPDPLPTPKED